MNFTQTIFSMQRYAFVYSFPLPLNNHMDKLLKGTKIKYSQVILQVWKTTLVNLSVKVFNDFRYNLLKKKPQASFYMCPLWKKKVFLFQQLETTINPMLLFQFIIGISFNMRVEKDNTQIKFAFLKGVQICD